MKYQRFKKIYEAKNNIITIAHDKENCLLFFLGFNGKTKTICYDDNFYTPIEDYYAFCDLLGDMVARNDIDEEDYEKCEKHFVKWLKKECLA